MQWPDYQGGSLVNLMQRIRSAAGGAVDERYPPLQHAALAGLEQRRVIVLLVIDGLGYEYLSQRGEGSCLQRHLRGVMTAGFPPTTAASISTFLTGQAVQQHALTGWFVYLKAVGAVTAVLPFHVRGSGELLSRRGLTAERLYEHRPFFSDLPINSQVIAPNWIIDTDFNRAHTGPARPLGYNDLDGMFDHLSNAIIDNADRQYIYAYWPDFDRLSHDFGNASEQVAEHFAELDARFARLVEQIDNDEISIIVTADHGFVDTTPERVITVDDHPRLQRALALPLCGEPRAAYCYVHPRQERSFVDYVEQELGEYLECHRSDALIEQGLFGVGEPHPALHERVGDYTLLMKANYVIKDWLAGEKRFFHYGVHGGISPQEMHVPLIVA